MSEKNNAAVCSADAGSRDVQPLALVLDRDTPGADWTLRDSSGRLVAQGPDSVLSPMLAAAPDLLAVAKLAEAIANDEVDHIDNEMCAFAELACKARAAIAKARGK